MNLCIRIGLFQVYLYILLSLVKLLVRVFLICVSKAFFKLYQKNLAVAQWLRCCATNRKVADSIPDGVIGIFH
jgi:hypothetical protein